jgi:serine/threonine protein kinase/tetratricopeptide (TPR) repeat protein
MLGKTLSHYRLVEQIGAGGMGVVYRARDERLERDVALKVLPAGVLSDAQTRSRFRREALALSKLNHPHIGTVHDFDTQEGIDFLVMEFVSGKTLGQRIQEGAIPVAEAVAIATQIAEALDEAHEQGVVHCDLKPDNVTVTAKGWVKVLDFGLAKLLHPMDAAAQTVSVGAADSVSGTLPYMAPEQLLAQPTDHRSDLFALGALLYEMATGRRAFKERLATALIAEILQKSPAPPSTVNAEVPPWLETVIAKCLEKDPDRRYQTAREVVEALCARGPTDVSSKPSRESGAVKRVESLAVLPLENLSGDPDQEYFADGMTEELIASLAQIGALRVISRTSVMRYKGARKPLPEIARELNVDVVVEGSVRRVGDRVRITAQLLEAATDRHLWAKSYVRDLRDVLALQGEVAQEIAQEIQVKLAPPEQARLAAARAVHPEAYEAFLRGRFYANRRTEGDLKRAVEHFNRAIELDPLYAMAHVGLADAFNLMGYLELLPPREAFPRAKAAASRALELDESLGEAHVSLAYGLHYFYWDWAAAEREFLRGLTLNDGYAQGHLWYSNRLACHGEFERAIAQIRRSLELDPLSLINSLALGWAYFLMRRFGEAVEQIRPTRDLDRSFVVSHWWLGWAYTLTGRLDDAVRSLEEGASISGRYPPVIAALGFARARQGRADEARAMLAELGEQARHRYVSSYDLALVHASLGEVDAAFQRLEQAFEERSHLMTFLRVDARLDSLRSDPRYQDLMRRVGHAVP